MDKAILSINIGSSSKKYSLYKGDVLLFDAHFEKDKDAFEVTYGKSEPVSISKNVFNDSLSAFYNAVKKDASLQKIDTESPLIGIRIVAPGEFFAEDRVIDATFMKNLEKVAQEDVAHILPIQKELERIQELFGKTKVYAISDSAFHNTMCEEAKHYALPKKIEKEYGLRRYGYHGISLSGITESLHSKLGYLPDKIIICHLGSGASITALKAGKSVDTSMGYSPLEGLVMSSRIGSIDAGAVLALLQHKTKEELQDFFYKECGLLGVSGTSNDMRVLIDKEKAGHKGSKEAIDAFVYAIQKYIGTYVSVLGGVDLIVFSGTIGERSFILRDRICSKLSWLNVHIDEQKNSEAKSGDYISVWGSLGVYVAHSDEDKEIARRVLLLQK